MKEDFTKTYNRLRNNSAKWLNMKQENPNVAENIVPFSVADMEFQMSAKIKEAIANYVSSEILGYTVPSEAYYKAVVDFFANYHKQEISRDWIVTTPGVVPALATSIRAFSKMGEGVIIFTPVYPPFYRLVEDQARRLEKVSLIYRDNRYYIDFDRLELLAKKDDVKMILLCNPHNPSGRVWDREDLERIIEIAKENKLVLVVDEIHSDYIHKGHHIGITSFESKYDRILACTSASKTFNIAGLQCANILIPNEKLRQEFEKHNNMVGIESPNVLGLVATQTAYSKGLDWMYEAKKHIEKNLQIVDEFFSQLSSAFRVMPIDASFLAWINFENLKISKNDFYKILYDADIYINKGESFGEEAEYFFRLNVGLPTQDLIDGLKRLDNLI